MAKKDGLTPKQERFALNLFQGMSQREAYVKAGYSDRQSQNAIDRNASILADNTKVLQRLVSLQNKAKSKAVATVQERKEILSQIARGEKKDIEVTTFPDGTKVTKVKLMNPTPAITELNKMEGIYSDGARINIAMIQAKPIEEYTDDELEAIIEGRIKLLPEGATNEE